MSPAVAPTMRKRRMKKRLSKLTLNRETLRNLSEPQLNQVAGGWSIVRTCNTCDPSCDPNSVRICPITWDC